MANWEMRFLGGKNNLSVATDRYTDSKIKDIKSKIKGGWFYIPNCLVRTKAGGPNKKLPEEAEENEEITNTRRQTLPLSAMQVHLYFTMVLTQNPQKRWQLIWFTSIGIGSTLRCSSLLFLFPLQKINKLWTTVYIHLSSFKQSAVSC